MTPVTEFQFALDTEIRFGLGCRRQVGSLAASWGERAALVTGATSYRDAYWSEEIDRSLRDAGITVELLLHGRGEPDTDAVDGAARRLAAVDAQVVIAVGGGSVIDLAKAAAIATKARRETAVLLVGQPVDKPVGIPVIAVPTTAGTGSEVSRGAIILDRVAGRKRGLRGRGVAPRAALVDPEVTSTTDARVTGESGVDAAAHAIETAFSRAASAINWLLSIDAIARLVPSVPAAVRNGSDLAAREQAAYAALMMGVNLATSTTCLPHRLQYPVGALTGTTHAVGIAALLPPWLERTLQVTPGLMARFAREARIADAQTPDAAAGARLVEAITDYVVGLVGRVRLRDLGVAQNDLPAIVDRTEGTLSNDPGDVDRLALLKLCEAAW